MKFIISDNEMLFIKELPNKISLKQHRNKMVTADDIDPDWKGFLKILEDITGDINERE